MFQRTFSGLADDIRARTDRRTDLALTNEELAVWINQAIRKVWTISALLGADEFTKVSSTFSITSGNTFTIATNGGTDGASDFLHLRGVDITFDSGAHFKPIRPWRLTERGRIGRLSYRLRGRVLEIQPPELARSYPYRLWYVFRPTEMLSMGDPIPGADTIDLPMHGDDFVAEHCAALVRVKFEEDPVLHLAAKKAAMDDMRAWLQLNYQGEPEVVLGADEADSEMWG